MLVPRVTIDPRRCLTRANQRTVLPAQLVAEPEQLQTHPPRSPPALRLVRPFIPRINPFTAVTKLYPEPIPTGSHDSFEKSPASAVCTDRSPRRMPRRKTSAQQRSPSPEPLMQDCAFPVFPTTRVKNMEASKKESLRGRAKTPDSSIYSRSYSRSTSLSTYRSRTRQGTTDSSRCSTANSSRQPSVSGIPISRKVSVDRVPPVPVSQPSSLDSMPLEATRNAAPVQVQTIQQPQSPVDLSVFTEHDTRALGVTSEVSFTTQEPVLSHAVPTLSPTPAPPELPMLTGTSEDSKEPSYRSKRPPPIVSLQSHYSDSAVPVSSHKSPAMVTPPTPSSSLARTFTGFFSRKRGQSMTSKRNGLRSPTTEGPRFMALSPEPDLHDLPSLTTNEESAKSSETQADETGMMHAHPEQLQPQQSSLKPGELIAPVVEQEIPIPEPSFGEKSNERLPAITRASELTTIDEHEAEIRRASIDSASSYGSIGFSHRSTSSRSTNITEAHSHASSISLPRSPYNEELTHLTSIKLQAPETIPESPMENSMLQSPHPSTSHEPIATPFIPLPVLEHALVPDTCTAPAESKTQRSSTPAGIKGVCRGCMNNILSGQKSVSSKDGRLTGRYHKECFTCKTCASPFATADFYVHDDQPYCSQHYHEVNGTLCTSCNKGIEGQYMETTSLTGQAGRKFHLECLRCTTCRTQLSEDYFELGGKVYCEKDAFRMASGSKSQYDNAPSRPSPLNREYISSGEPNQSLLSSGKFPERRLTRLMMI